MQINLISKDGSKYEVSWEAAQLSELIQIMVVYESEDEDEDEDEKGGW